MEIKKIEILNEQDFDRVIDKYDFEKFICTGEKFDESECKFRIAFYSDRDLFDEITESRKRKIFIAGSILLKTEIETSVHLS